MTTTTAVPNFEKRRAFYEIDERGMALLAETWPVIEPVVSDAINKVVDKILALPYAQQTANQHRDFIKDLEIGHYRILLGGNLDLRCAESCRYTVEQEPHAVSTPASAPARATSCSRPLCQRLHANAASPRPALPSERRCYRRSSVSTSPTP